MTATITQPELNLLEYLRKHSGRSGERIALDPKPVMRSLRIGTAQFAQDAASLRAMGYAGVRDFRPNSQDIPSAICSSIWITKKGEDYLRENVRQLQALLPAKSAVKAPVG